MHLLSVILSNPALFIHIYNSMLTNLFEFRHSRIFSYCLTKHKPVLFSVFSYIGKTRCNRSFFIFQMYFLTVYEQLTRYVFSITLSEYTSGKFRSSCSLKSCKTDNLTFMYIERYFLINYFSFKCRMVNRPVLHLKS